MRINLDDRYFILDEYTITNVRFLLRDFYDWLPIKVIKVNNTTLFLKLRIKFAINRLKRYHQTILWDQKYKIGKRQQIEDILKALK